MPIKDKGLYGQDWDQISRERRNAAGQRCEECGVLNGAYGYRVGQQFYQVDATNMAEAEAICRAAPGRPKAIRIVLTVHHLDENPGNQDPSNLAVLCQKHHLAYHRRPKRTVGQAALF